MTDKTCQYSIAVLAGNILKAASRYYIKSTLKFSFVSDWLLSPDRMTTKLDESN